RLDRSAFFAFLAARFSFKLLPCFLFCPEGGALFAIPGPYAQRRARERHSWRAGQGRQVADPFSSGESLPSALRQLSNLRTTAPWCFNSSMARMKPGIGALQIHDQHELEDRRYGSVGTYTTEAGTRCRETPWRSVLSTGLRTGSRGTQPSKDTRIPPRGCRSTRSPDIHRRRRDSVAGLPTASLHLLGHQPASRARTDGHVACASWAQSPHRKADAGHRDVPT